MVICVDFDGTLVKHRYPEIGRTVTGAVETLKKLHDNGHLIILNTMRSRDELIDAVNWCSDKGITLYGVNENPTQKNWTTSTKCYAHLYIDDAALGCPVFIDEEDNERVYVNWVEVAYLLKLKGLIR